MLTSLRHFKITQIYLLNLQSGCQHQGAQSGCASKAGSAATCPGKSEPAPHRPAVRSSSCSGACRLCTSVRLLMRPINPNLILRSQQPNPCGVQERADALQQEQRAVAACSNDRPGKDALADLCRQGTDCTKLFASIICHSFRQSNLTSCAWLGRSAGRQHLRALL